MNAPCDCCASMRQWVLEHLNFNPHAPGVNPKRWGERRWLTWARECSRFWESQGEPIEEVDLETLASAMRDAYL